jgi:hypothetical protein
LGSIYTSTGHKSRVRLRVTCDFGLWRRRGEERRGEEKSSHSTQSSPSNLTASPAALYLARSRRAVEELDRLIERGCGTARPALAWHRTGDWRCRAGTEEKEEGLSGAPLVHIRARSGTYRSIQSPVFVFCFWLISLLQITHAHEVEFRVDCQSIALDGKRRGGDRTRARVRSS